MDLRHGERPGHPDTPASAAAGIVPAGPARALPPARRSYVGAVSLCVAVIGALASRIALAHDAAETLPWLPILAAGFDAAMVGGIADWFAVTALFRHPLGIPIPHTALIVERRDKLVDGIVATVQDEWLSPEVIGAKLAAFAPSAVVRDWLRDPEHVGRLGGPVRDVLRGAARLLTEPEVTAFAERTIRRELGGLPVEAVGRFLAIADASASARAAFTSAALSIANLADRPRTAEDLRFWLDRSAATLRAGGKRLVPMLLRRRLVQRKLVEAICSYASAELRAAAADDAHPLRRTVFGAIRGFGERIVAGDERALAQADALRRALVESLDADPLVRSALAELRRQLEEDLTNDASALSDLVDRRLRTTIVDWLDDPERRAWFDGWVRTMSQDLLRRHHHQIGRTVRDYLDKLKDAELVERIEARVGADLQYIRLNGAVIGGLVGVLLAVLHALFGH
ncbi:MAG: DUF445 domain-containing protein [Deltaproteobacteria bacterium]|nr:DUF445 domain-containing protein [Deltaproteobacteria bacterium]